MQIRITSKDSGSGVLLSRLKEFLEYRDLLMMLVKREIVVMYKQSIIGMGWVIMRPLIQMVIFTFVFGAVLNVADTLGGKTPYAAFSFAALVPWTYFSTVLNLSSGSLIANYQFLNKVYFPRIIIPLSPVIAKLADFAVAFLVLLVLLFYYGYYPTLQYLYLPLLIVIMVASVLGLGLWFSAIAVQFRDVQHIVMFATQVLIYATPVIWPITLLPEKLVTVYGFYPMVGVIEGFRAVLLHYDSMPWLLIGESALTAAILLVTGILFFNSRQSKFADIA